jgi:hypothetical protein
MKLLWLLLPAILLGIFLSSPAKAAVPPLGSQANPIPLSEPAQRIFDGYVPHGSVQDAYSHGGWVTSPPHSTLWFVIDPYAVLGRPAKGAALGWKWWEGRPSISYIQNKATGEYAPGINLGGLQIYYDNNPYDVDKYRFLWAFVNNGDVAFTWSIWATIAPYAGVDTCTSAGDKCMPTYCNLYPGDCHESSATCVESFCCTGTCGSGTGFLQPSGPLGSKTNPIPMNKPNPFSSTTYYASTAIGSPAPSSTLLSPDQKTWFVVDSAVTGKTIKRFYWTVQGYNNPDLVYTKVVQDKAGNDLSAEVTLLNNGGDTFDQVTNNMPYNFGTTKFLYSIQSIGRSFTLDVLVNFIPQ